jgi:hypothetical protein
MNEGSHIHEAASTLGQRGGSVTSPRKTRAARQNAQSGGRPRGGSKFRQGDRVRANDKAPGDYQGKAGTVWSYETDSQYWVEFDGDHRGPGCLRSWWLDRIS